MLIEMITKETRLEAWEYASNLLCYDDEAAQELYDKIMLALDELSDDELYSVLHGPYSVSIGTFATDRGLA